MKTPQLFVSARILARFGTDGRWWLCFYDEKAEESYWEDLVDSPVARYIVHNELRSQLKLSTKNATEAVRYLARHPEDPATFAFVTAATGAPETPETGNSGDVHTS